MIIGIPKEIMENERRVSALPEDVRKYGEMGFETLVESTAGEGALHPDGEYANAGAEILDDPVKLFSRADVILKVKQPCFNEKAGRHEADMIKEGGILIAFLHPAAPANHDIIRKLSDRNITGLTMDGIPRISRAQKMDALTSMSTVSGYKSVIIAAGLLPRFIPMIGTAIGAIKPARALVMGSGVVGLQAIATAKRLGAQVKAVDIRAAAKKEAESLGIKVPAFDVPEDLALGEGGYAKALPAEWLEKEREALKPLVRESDIIILSSLVPGEVSPVLVTDDMLKEMNDGSVIVDVAIDQGGNCESTKPGCQIVKHGVVVCGILNIPGSVPVHASWLYGRNMFEYVKNLFKNGVDAPDLEDEIVRHSLVTYGGKIVHKGTLKAMGEE